MPDTVGFQNGDLVARNITFDYTTDPQPAQPGVITADGQLLIGSVISHPNIAMQAGMLTSTGGTVTITYDDPNINLESVAEADVTILTSDGPVSPVLGEFDFTNVGGNVIVGSTAPGVVTFDASPVLDLLTFHLVVPNDDVTPAAGIINFDSAGGTVTMTQTGPNTINFETAGGMGTLDTLTPDTGGAVSPIANNINVLGLPILAGQTQHLQTSTSNIGGATLQIKAPNCALFIVDSDALYGTHTTIQSAVTDAATQQVASGINQTVFIRPGVYTEDVTMAPGVSLSAFACDPESPNVSIVGQILINTAGPISVSGIRCITNGDYAIAVTTTAAVPQITFRGCTIIAADFNAINTEVNCNLRFSYCDGDITDGASAFCTLNAGTVTFNFCRMFNISASSGISVIDSANLNMSHTNWNNRISTLPGASHGATFCSFRTGGLSGPIMQFTSSGVEQYAWTYCSIDSQAVAAIDITTPCAIQLRCVNIDCFGATAISGTGTINYNVLTFSNTTSTCSVATQNAGFVGPRIALSDGGCQVISAAGSPNGAVTAPQGSLFLRTDGSGINDRAYINTDSGTTWTALVTLA